MECKSLSEILFDPGGKPKEIGRRAFQARGIASIGVPESVETIGLSDLDMNAFLNAHLFLQSPLRQIPNAK
jgi:hypothetical protein